MTKQQANRKIVISALVVVTLVTVAASIRYGAIDFSLAEIGRASNVYLVVGKGGGGDGGGVNQMIEFAGGEMAVENTGRGMQRMESPEIIAKANPDVILLTDFGYDRLGSLDQIKALPGVATSNAARNNRIYRIEENVLNYFGPRSGENIAKVAAIIHKK